MAVFVVLVVVWCVLGGVIGRVIGNGKGRSNEGFWWGFFLGWIGWIIVAVMSPSAEAEARHNMQVARATRSMVGDQRLAATAYTRALELVPERPGVNDGIRSAAAQDANREAIEAAVRTLERQQSRDVSMWMFADGPAPLLVRLDGTTVMVGENVWQVLSRDADHGTSPDGELRVIRFSTKVFANLRPPGRVAAFLGSVPSVESPTMNARAAELALAQPQAVKANRTDNMISERIVEVRPSGDVASSVHESLKALEVLRVDGLVNDAEYSSKRDQILGRL